MKKEGRQTDLTQGSIFKGLFYFSLPLLAASLVQQLYNTVDLICVGNILGKNASAAVGSSSLLTICIIGFFSGLGVGVSVIVSHYFGANQEKGIHDTIHTAIGLTLILGVVIVVAGILACPFFLRLMQTPASIMDLAETYLKIYLVGVLGIVVYNVASGIMRAMGDSRTPMIYQIIGGVINVFGDLFFLLVLHMGVSGAALATVLSQGIAALLSLYHLTRLPDAYRLKASHIHIRKDLSKRIFVIAIPEAIRSMLITVANLLVQTQINTLGVDSMAAYASYTKAEGFLYLPQWAVGQANTMLVGQNLGAGKMKRVEKSTRIALLMGMGITAIISTLILIFPMQFFRMFSNQREIIVLSTKIAQKTFALYFLYAIVEILSGTIRGAGQSMPPMVISLINMCGIRVVVLKILAQYFHTVNQLAIVFPITWITTSLSVVLYYFFGHWREKSTQLDRHLMEQE
jgi:putative MATE family efflux protein